MSSDLQSFIKSLIDEKTKELKVSLPAKIEEYYPQKGRADIVLLNKEKVNEEFQEITPILNCPVRMFKAGKFVIRPPYSKGDTVQVVFSDRALDNLLVDGDSNNPQLKRKHSIDDAMVTGGLTVEQGNDLPSENTSDLYIANLENHSKITVLEDGTIKLDNDTTQVEINKGGDLNITTSKNVNLDCADATITADNTKVDSGSVELGQGTLESLVKNNFLSSVFNGHTHIGNLGAPTAPPTPLGSPTNTTSSVKGG